MRSPSRSRTVATALCLGGLLSATASQAAEPKETVVLTCPGTNLTTYSPPITNTPKPTVLDSNSTFGPCAGLFVPQGLVGAKFNYKVNGNLSCNAGTSTADVTIQWNDGSTSIAKGAAISLRPAGEVVAIVEGPITSGRFAGGFFNYNVVLAQTNVTACASTGVPAVAGPATLTVVNL